METWAVWAGLALAFLALLELIRLNLMLRNVLKNEQKLPELDPNQVINSPLVSIIIPAKDEEKHVGRTAILLLSSDYKNLELILVDDRSRDRTLKIMRDISDMDPRVKVLSLKELPEKWTGKTHALFRGAELASGEILLFSDADVALKPETITRALNLLVSQNIDVLGLLPGFIERGFSENVVYPHLAFGFSYFYPLSLVNDDTRQEAMASGCFIMMTRHAYKAIGTWKRFRNEITEDVALSKEAKAKGLKFRLFRGEGLVRTRSFASLNEMCNFWIRTFYGGFEKKLLNVSRLLLNYFFIILLFFLMLWSGALWIIGGQSFPVAVLFACSSVDMAAIIIPFSLLIRQEGSSWIWGLTVPLGALISLWVTINTLGVIILDKGIKWRGKIYK